MQLTEAFFRKLDENASARECFTELFGFISAHREFYTYYLSEGRRNSVLQLAWELISDRVSGANIPIQLFGVATKEELEYQGAFFVFGLTALVRMWLQNGCREDPAILYDILRRQSTVQDRMLDW